MSGWPTGEVYSLLRQESPGPPVLLGLLYVPDLLVYEPDAIEDNREVAPRWEVYTGWPEYPLVLMLSGVAAAESSAPIAWFIPQAAAGSSAELPPLDDGPLRIVFPPTPPLIEGRVT